MTEDKLRTEPLCEVHGAPFISPGICPFCDAHGRGVYGNGKPVTWWRELLYTLIRAVKP